MMISGSGQVVKLITATDAVVDYNIEYIDYIPNSTFFPNTEFGRITSETTTLILTGSTGLRKVRFVSVVNTSTSASQTVTFLRENAGSQYNLLSPIVLRPLESLVIDQNDTLSILDSSGRIKTKKEFDMVISGTTYNFRKQGSGAEIAGSGSTYFSSAGYPGAWFPGTPGLAGRACSGSSPLDSGSIQIPNYPGQYLQSFTAASTVLNSFEVIDVLWTNSGIVHTTTTLQTISSSTFPARDLYGSNSGYGLQVGLLITTATTNATANTTAVLQYTNQDGVPNRWASVSSSNSLSFIPATAVAGFMVPFNLQAGDEGIRSIQGITLGTSLVAGTSSLVVYKPLLSVGCPVINTAFTTKVEPPGIKLWGGEVLLFWSPIITATNATTVYGNLIINTYSS